MATVQTVFDRTVDSFAYLYSRWNDEREHEPWNNYIQAMKHLLEEHGATFISAAKRPFGCTFKIAGDPRTHQFRVTANSVRWLYKS